MVRGQENLKEKPWEVKGTIMRHQNEQTELDEDLLRRKGNAVQVPGQSG